MSHRYVKQATKTATTATPVADVYEGEFVTMDGADADPTDPAADSVVSGIVPHKNIGQHLPEHEYDFSEVKYESGMSFMPVQLLEDKMQVFPKTVADETATAPAIDPGNVVGVIADPSSGRPVVVEEGYATNGTTYGRSDAGAFLAVGVAEETGYEYDDQVQLRVHTNLLASR